MRQAEAGSPVSQSSPGSAGTCVARTGLSPHSIKRPHVSAPDPKHVLTLDRTLDAPAARLWRCWTEPDLLKQWFCPKPWYVSDATIDLAPGGAFFTVMNGPDGERFENADVVLAFEPQRRLVTTDAFLLGWIPSDKAFMTAHVTFKDAGDDRTRYVARAMHWNEETLRQHEEMGFFDGWGAAADQLEELARSV